MSRRTIAGKALDVPSTFMGGKKDWGVYRSPGSLERLEKTVATKYQAACRFLSRQ